MTTQGTNNLLALAQDLRQTAPHVREWYDIGHAATLMEQAADAIVRLAKYEPDLQVERGKE